MTSFEQLLRSLAEARVDCIVVGGIAGGLHGAARTTYDLDASTRATRRIWQGWSARSDLSSPTFAVLPPDSRFGGTPTRSSEG